MVCKKLMKTDFVINYTYSKSVDIIKQICFAVAV